MKLVPLHEQSMLNTLLCLPKERTTHGSRLITETWPEIQVSSTEEAKEKIKYKETITKDTFQENHGENIAMEKPEKFRTLTGFEPVTSRCPVQRSNQLSYEATDIESLSFGGFNVPVSQ